MVVTTYNDHLRLLSPEPLVVSTTKVYAGVGADIVMGSLRVGFTFKRGDVADLERMLRLLMDDSAVRSAAGRSAQHRVRDGYLWPRIARQVEQVYLEAMGWKGFQSDPDELPSIVPGRGSAA
jgi:glycosyltransferase involved in cell wall biosynthesis